MANENQNVPAVTYYTPLELIGLYRSYFERSKANSIVWLRGIYVQRANQNRNYSTAFDDLRDVNTQNSVTLKINWADRERLQNNSLVMVGGLIELNAFQNGNIQIAVNVTRLDIIQDQFVTEQDLRRQELLLQKNASHRKNVNQEISQLLFEGRRPRIALVIAQNTRTRGDFEDGLRAARGAIDFEEFLMTLTHTQELCNTLRVLDERGFTAIAIYRGGGVDSTTDVDKLEVLQVVASMQTPFISGVGHEPEEIFLRQIADEWTTTPQGLGQYFSEIVEKVAARRNNSRAALVKEVEQQFRAQIEAGQKQNKALQDKLTALTNAQADAQKLHSQQLDAANKQNTALQGQLKKISEDNQRSLSQMALANRQLQSTVSELNGTIKNNERMLMSIRMENKRLRRRYMLLCALFVLAAIIFIMIIIYI